MINYKTMFMAMLCLAAFVNYANAQESSDSKKEKKKWSDNITPISKRFDARITYSLQSSQLDIMDANGEGEQLTYKPNILSSTGAKVRFGIISLSYDYLWPGTDERLRIFGDTKANKFGLDVETRTISLNFDFINYRGFYLANPENVTALSIANDGVYPFAPDFGYLTVGLKTSIIFNRAFSTKAAFDQTEIMKKSAGSFMIGTGNRFSRYYYDSIAPIPNDQSAHYQKFFQSDLNGFNINTTYLAFGGGYSFVKGHFSFTPILLVGSGVQFQGYKDEKETGISNLKLRAPLYFHYRNALGFNHENFFARLTWSAELDRARIVPKGVSKNIDGIVTVDYSASNNKTILNMLHLDTEISVGMRFLDKKKKKKKE